MKKILLALIAACLGAGVFAQNAVIGELAGTVELKKAGAEEFIRARDGDQLEENTVVSTGFKSSAVITTGSAMIMVRPLTRLSFGELVRAQGQENVTMNLRAGSVRVDVKPAAGLRASFSVISPIATASVRGTSFELDTRNLTVREGMVLFRGSRGAPLRVYAGSSSKVFNYTGRPVDPIIVAENDLLPPPPAGADMFPQTTVIVGEAAAEDSGFTFTFTP